MGVDTGFPLSDFNIYDTSQKTSFMLKKTLGLQIAFLSADDNGSIIGEVAAA